MLVQLNLFSRIMCSLILVLWSKSFDHNATETFTLAFTADHRVSSISLNLSRTEKLQNFFSFFSDHSTRMAVLFTLQTYQLTKFTPISLWYKMPFLFMQSVAKSRCCWQIRCLTPVSPPCGAKTHVKWCRRYCHVSWCLQALGPHRLITLNSIKLTFLNLSRSLFYLCAQFAVCTRKKNILGQHG